MTDAMMSLKGLIEKAPDSDMLREMISFAAERLEAVKDSVGECPFRVIGKVHGAELEIVIDGSSAISEPVAELESAWRDSLQNLLEPKESSATA